VVDILDAILGNQVGYFSGLLDESNANRSVLAVEVGGKCYIPYSEWLGSVCTDLLFFSLS